MISKTLEAEELLESSLEDLKKQGFDVSEESNISRILNSISSSNSSDRKNINEIINRLTFDNRSGDMLDELYNFFGIPRIIKNVTGASIQVLNNGIYTLDIGANTFIEAEGKTFRVTTQQYINPKESKTIYCYPTETKMVDGYAIIGDYKIQLRNLNINKVPESEKESYLIDNILINNLNLTLDKETDLEYKARANGLIQHFSDGSISKIKSYIMGIEHVSNVKLEKEFNRTKIIIIPEELKYMEQVLAQAKEAVDYFSSSPIIFDYPSITELKVSGITEQLVKWFNQSTQIQEMLSGIKLYLDEYTKEVYLSGSNTISRDSIEFTINKYFIDNEIVFSLNENKINISYAIYSEEDYLEAIITNELAPRQKKEIKTDILIVGGVE